jgi:hypothetical protein
MSALSLSRMVPVRWQNLWATLSSWEDDLDVSGGRQRAAWWAWVLLALGALAVMVAMDHVDSLRIQQDDVAEQVKRLSRADRQLRLQRALAAQAVAPAASGQVEGKDANSNAPALQGAAVPAARRMAGLLAYPWPAHLDLLDTQAAQAQVVMTQLSASLDNTESAQVLVGPASARARWRMQAFAKDDASALAWAQRLPQGELLSREPAPQPFTTRAGTYGVRVSLEMRP